jgi:hypothetical protein
MIRFEFVLVGIVFVVLLFGMHQASWHEGKTSAYEKVARDIEFAGKFELFDKVIVVEECK